MPSHAESKGQLAGCLQCVVDPTERPHLLLCDVASYLMGGAIDITLQAFGSLLEVEAVGKASKALQRIAEGLEQKIKFSPQ